MVSLLFVPLTLAIVFSPKKIQSVNMIVTQTLPRNVRKGRDAITFASCTWRESTNSEFLSKLNEP